jgi:Fe-S-cluster containining protein
MSEPLQPVRIEVAWHGRKFGAEVGLPETPARPRFLLTLVQHITDAVVNLADAAVRDSGKSITCRAGCGACCRQLVPVTPSEAHHLRDLVENLPEPRRSEIRARFESGKERLAEAGLLQDCRDADRGTDRLALGRAYFQLGIACPFLEEENCSIHADRPLECREYLVTSPADHCRADHDGTIRKVLLPVRPMPAFARLDGESPAGGPPWVPLMLALDWAREHPEPEPAPSAADLFTRFMDRLQTDAVAQDGNTFGRGTTTPRMPP